MLYTIFLQGSLFFWGGDSAQQQRRTRLLYRVLFAMPGHQSIQRNTLGDAKPVVVTPDVQAEAKSNDTKTTKAEIKKLTVEEVGLIPKFETCLISSNLNFVLSLV